MFRRSAAKRGIESVELLRTAGDEREMREKKS